MKTKSKRLANIELLRILAMLMVVMLHYLGKAALLPMPGLAMNAQGYVAWIMEALCIVAVNVYVLISGYFLVQSQFKFGRVVELVLQVLFYAILVTAVAYALGIVGNEIFGIYNLTVQLFPFQMQEYWFMTAYLIMYLLSPFLAAGAKAVSQKQLKVSILLLLTVFCFVKSILPVDMALGNHGYDALWLICLFLIAAYIRLYGIKFLEKPWSAALLYFGSCFMIFAETFVLGIIYEKTGKLGMVSGSSYHYNHIFNLLASIGLFMWFLNMKIPEGKVSRIICKISPYTLGVYLLHDHIYVRNLWTGWLKAGSATNVVTFVLMALGSVLLVFVIGIVVDYFRSLLFKLGSKLIHGKKAGKDI